METARSAEQVAGDDLALDLAGALVDPGSPDLAVQLLQEVAALQRPGPEDLHCRVHHPLSRLGGEQLGHGRPAGHVGGAPVVPGRGRVHEEPGRLGSGGHLGEGVADGLELPDRAPERLASRPVLDGRIERGPGHPHGERPYAGAEQVQRPHGHLEPGVDLAEDLIRADRDPVEPEPADRVGRQKLEWVAGQAVGVAGHGERRHALRTGLRGGPGEHRVHVGVRRVRDPGLLASQPPAVAVAFGGELQPGRVGSVLRLGQRERGHGPAGGDLGNPPLHQHRRSRLEDRVRPKPLEGQGRLGFGRLAGQGLAKEAQGGGRDLAVLGEQSAEEAFTAEGLDQLPADPAGPRGFGDRLEDVPSDPACLLDQRGLLGRPCHRPDHSRGGFGPRRAPRYHDDRTEQEVRMAESPYWNPRHETMPRQEIDALQVRKLRNLLEWTTANVPWHAKRLADAGVTPDSISSLDDLRRIPFTTRDEWMQGQLERPPYGTVLAQDPEKAIRYHMTSGTTGKTPIRVLDGMKDWEWIAEMWCYGLWGFGV